MDLEVQEALGAPNRSHTPDPLNAQERQVGLEDQQDQVDREDLVDLEVLADQVALGDLAVPHDQHQEQKQNLLRNQKVLEALVAPVDQVDQVCHLNHD